MRFTGLEVVGEPKRGRRRCPSCRELSLERVETDARDIPCDRGAAVCTRTYECVLGACGVVVRFVEVSLGAVDKRWSREADDGRRTEQQGEPVIQVSLSVGQIVLKA